MIWGSFWDHFGAFVGAIYLALLSLLKGSIVFFRSHSRFRWRASRRRRFPLDVVVVAGDWIAAASTSELASTAPSCHGLCATSVALGVAGLDRVPGVGETRKHTQDTQNVRFRDYLQYWESIKEVYTEHDYDGFAAASRPQTHQHGNVCLHV